MVAILKTFATLKYHTLTCAWYTWYASTIKKHQTFWPRSCRVDEKFGTGSLGYFMQSFNRIDSQPDFIYIFIYIYIYIFFFF